MKSTMLALGLIVTVAARAAAPTAEDVGDPDSFGRNQIYLGLVITPTVALQADCTPDPDFPAPPEDRCVTLNPQPAATSFDESKLGSLNLPANASRSLLCFSITPFAEFDLANDTAGRQTALASARAPVTIRNAVLDDPRLIDPNTGQPFGGRISTSLSAVFESRTLDPGESDLKSTRYSRSCIGGLISKSSLIALGLSDAQATQFFATPMQLSFGAAGSVRIVRSGFFGYGIRLYGDK